MFQYNNFLVQYQIYLRIFILIYARDDFSIELRLKSYNILRMKVYQNHTKFLKLKFAGILTKYSLRKYFPEKLNFINNKQRCIFSAHLIGYYNESDISCSLQFRLKLTTRLRVSYRIREQNLSRASSLIDEVYIRKVFMFSTGCIGPSFYLCTCPLA